MNKVSERKTKNEHKKQKYSMGTVQFSNNTCDLYSGGPSLIPGLGISNFTLEGFQDSLQSLQLGVEMACFILSVQISFWLISMVHMTQPYRPPRPVNRDYYFSL
jgi:hypothetical protein